MADQSNQNPGPDQGPDQSEQPTTPADRPATATAVKTRPSPPRVDRLPPYRVLLHNDDVHDMLDVVNTIVELTPIDRTRATLVMLEAHTTGVAMLLVTHKERAELYRDQFRSKQLTVTIEQAE